MTNFMINHMTNHMIKHMTNHMINHIINYMINYMINNMINHMIFFSRANSKNLDPSQFQGQKYYIFIKQSVPLHSINYPLNSSF